MHFPQIHGGLSVKGSPSGRAGERSETERARMLTANPRHCDSIALTKSLPIAAPTALSCRACPLRHCSAMPPLPKGEALARRKAQKKIPRGGRNSLGDFSLLEMKALGSHISVFIICDSPQKSSTVRKVYKPDLCSKARLCTTSPSRLRRATSPTEGRPWHSGKLLLFARGSPTRGAVERSETERLYEGEPDRKH